MLTGDLYPTDDGSYALVDDDDDNSKGITMNIEGYLKETYTEKRIIAGREYKR